MLSMAVSKPLPVPTYFKPNWAHLTFALKLLSYRSPESCELGPTNDSVYLRFARTICVALAVGTCSVTT